MQFFFYEIVARVVSAYLCFDTYRTLRRGLTDGTFVPFEPDGVNWILDSFRDRAALTVHRDATPTRFWVSIGLEVLLLLACLYVAIFGWSQTGA
ncbi:hypothetical protein [Tardiphaga sp. 709]|uniref:hypothetical protein n=1 Tax=Tardiphaga sp. 709 TaxID=3076039 RepID=UPI0028E9FDDD|nr:hypothetical protein [Tardiphaga sp. 709]WNV08896.1 hypothetical protein RSO67_26030 [Tardiphaga sp. 709]